MKKVGFNIHKLGIRAVVAIGALFSLSVISCFSCTYGPSPNYDRTHTDSVEVSKDENGVMDDNDDISKSTDNPNSEQNDNNVE